jgi:hypothetical protein
MMVWRDQAEHAAVSLSMAAGWLVLEPNGALSVEQRDRTEEDPAVPAPIGAAFAPGERQGSAPAAVSG